eukprot:1826429-Lingulodinium_polyedra.AAC.1
MAAMPCSCGRTRPPRAKVPLPCPPSPSSMTISGLLMILKTIPSLPFASRQPQLKASGPHASKPAPRRSSSSSGH